MRTIYSAKRISAVLTTLAVFAGLLLAAILLYRPVLTSSFIADDYLLYSEARSFSLSALINPISVLGSCCYRPLPMSVWWLEAYLFGDASLPGHLINVALHAGTAALLFLFLARAGVSRTASVATAALFLVTPVAPESVTWLSGRFDVMSLFFLMLCLFLYMEFIKSGSRAAYGLSLVAMAGGLLSKENAVVVIILLPFLELMFGQEEPVGRAGAGALISQNSIISTRPPLKKRIQTAALRLLPFALLLIVLATVRSSLIGLGTYKPLLVTPGFVSLTLLKFIAPLNSNTTSHLHRLIVEAYTVFLLAVSLGLVLLRWKKAAAPARRLWIFLAVSLPVSFLPVFWLVFTDGIHDDLNGSRMIYAPTLLFVALIVTGLIEFGWHSRYWRVPALAALAALALIDMHALVYDNNPAWQQTADFFDVIPAQMQTLLPDPPPGARIYVVFDRDWTETGREIDGTLGELLRRKYGRGDLVAEDLFNAEQKDTGDGWLFVYEKDKGGLKLERPPLRTQ